MCLAIVIVIVGGLKLSIHLVDQKREYMTIRRQWKSGLFQFTDDAVTLAISKCAGALPSRMLCVLMLKSSP